MLPNVRFRLSLMMFLQFFIWGAWYVTLGTYLANALKADGVQIGAAYSAMAIATIISPFFVGMIADRFFSAQKLLAVLHIAGAAVLFYMTNIKNANAFYWWVLLYSLLYAPTLALSNAVAFGQMKNAGQSFAGIRVFGTIGWIVAGICIDRVFHLEASQMAFTFKMAAIASGALGILSFLLPETPPKAKGQKATFGQILGSDAFVLFKDKSFVTFFFASILICIPLSFYYSQANQFLNEVGMKNAASNMTFGQFSEAIFILLIPVLFRKLGVKWMIMIGMLAWVLRFLCFGYGNADAGLWMLFGGIILHGVCYDFFFVTGQIYTDNKAGENIKGSAQGMITMATYGVGMWIGSLLSGYVAKLYTVGENVHQWRSIWLIPAGISGAVLILFGLFFTDKKKENIV